MLHLQILIMLVYIRLSNVSLYSYGVVLWELLTGEKPYGNLNAFVVAYGVGRGTLSLPIPAGCPESFQELMSGQCFLPLFSSLSLVSPLSYSNLLSLSFYPSFHTSFSL